MQNRTKLIHERDHRVAMAFPYNDALLYCDDDALLADFSPNAAKPDDAYYEPTLTQLTAPSLGAGGYGTGGYGTPELASGDRRVMEFSLDVDRIGDLELTPTLVEEQVVLFPDCGNAAVCAGPMTQQSQQLSDVCAAAAAASDALICEMCDGAQTDVDSYLAHLQSQHPALKCAGRIPGHGAPLALDSCGCRFWTIEGLQRHLLLCHGLLARGLLEKAQKEEDGGRCMLCGEEFEFKIVQHLVVAHGQSLLSTDISYSCGICSSFQCLSYQKLEEHLSWVHPEVATSFCDGEGEGAEEEQAMQMDKGGDLEWSENERAAAAIESDGEQESDEEQRAAASIDSTMQQQPQWHVMESYGGAVVDVVDDGNQKCGRGARKRRAKLQPRTANLAVSSQPSHDHSPSGMLQPAVPAMDNQGMSGRKGTAASGGKRTGSSLVKNEGVKKGRNQGASGSKKTGSSRVNDPKRSVKKDDVGITDEDLRQKEGEAKWRLVMANRAQVRVVPPSMQQLDIEYEGSFGGVWRVVVDTGMHSDWIGYEAANGLRSDWIGKESRILRVNGNPAPSRNSTRDVAKKFVDQTSPYSLVACPRRANRGVIKYFLKPADKEVNEKGEEVTMLKCPGIVDLKTGKQCERVEKFNNNLIVHHRSEHCCRKSHICKACGLGYSDIKHARTHLLRDHFGMKQIEEDVPGEAMSAA